MQVSLFNNSISRPPKPFLRWAGGKVWLTRSIGKFLPEKYENYYEPFLGGGSIFFHLKPKSSCLTDLNQDLINTYVQLKDNLSETISHLRNFEDNKAFYYELRKKKSECPVFNAAKFIYFNRTSFNGIYRVNRNGEYNVPYGKRKKSDIIDQENLNNVSLYLRDSVILNCDFESALSKAKKNDLVFLDPPYTVMHENNGFVAYNQKIFSWEDQERLATTVKKMIRDEVNVIMTNAYHQSILTLYGDVKDFIHPISRSSNVGGKGAKRGTVNEIIISNCI